MYARADARALVRFAHSSLKTLRDNDDCHSEDTEWDSVQHIIYIYTIYILYIH